MNKSFIAIAAGLVILSGCKENIRLDFQADKDGVWHVPEKQMDKWAQAIIKSDDSRAAALLDMGYGKADSLSAEDPDARTLEAFAHAVADRFLDINSPFYDERACELALDREADCLHWTSWGRRGVDWRRSILNLNRPGTRVSDFWLSNGEEGQDTLLRQLLSDAPFTVLFIYGESCQTCKKMMEEIRASRRFAQMASNGKIQFISLYTGEDTQEFISALSQFPDYWKNWRDRENVVKYDRAFDNRMIPSLYVIDNSETVILRGKMKVNEIEKFFTRKGNY